MALRWFYAHSLVREQGLTKEHIDRIPGKHTDRKTPLGELNWIFTAVTDTIAWNLLPRALFQRLFRQVRMTLFLIIARLLSTCLQAKHTCGVGEPQLLSSSCTESNVLCVQGVEVYLLAEQHHF